MYIISMELYAFMNNKGSKQVAHILEEMKFPLDRSWKYSPNYVMSQPKQNDILGTNDHE